MDALAGFAISSLACGFLCALVAMVLAFHPRATLLSGLSCIFLAAIISGALTVLAVIIGIVPREDHLYVSAAVCVGATIVYVRYLKSRPADDRMAKAKRDTLLQVLAFAGVASAIVYVLWLLCGE